MDKGSIHIYCGEGKGKTTAAIGQGIQEASQGRSVIIIQFMKERNAEAIGFVQRLALEVFDNDAVVSVETLIEQGIVKNPRDGVKILGNGELTKKLTVQANAFSAGAVAKIEALGGKAEVI